MKYLDEQIEVTIANITVPTSKTYIYLVLVGTNIVFTGNTFLTANDTQKTFNITDIVSNYAYINPHFDGLDKNIITKITVNLFVDTNTYTANSDNIYLAYRYPHMLKRLEYDGKYNIQSGLLPVYPNNLTINYAINETITYTGSVFNEQNYLIYNNGTKTGSKNIYNTPSTIGSYKTISTSEKLSDMNNYAPYGTYTQISNDLDLTGQEINTEIRGDDGFLHYLAGNTFDVAYISKTGVTFTSHNLGTFNIANEGQKTIEFETIDADSITSVLFILGGVPSVEILTSQQLAPKTKYVLNFWITLYDAPNDEYAVEDIALSLFVPAIIEKGIYIENRNSVGFSTIKKIGEFCDKLDGYYLQWQDRLGSVQSQHFCKVNKFSINYETQTITDYRGNSRNINIQTTHTFEINSDWISEELYPYYESIFVSPCLKLYDVKEDKIYDVILKDKQYEEKTFKNQGRKLFNLNLKLEENKKQNIIY